MTTEEIKAVYSHKMWVFQNALRKEESLWGYNYDSTKEGLNAWDDRYWTAVLHQQRPNTTYNRVSGLSYHIDSCPTDSILFIYDTETGKRLLISMDPLITEPYNRFIIFGQVYAEQQYVVVQPSWGELRIYKFNESLEIEAQLACALDSSFEERIISLKVTSDGRYMALLDNSRQAMLLKVDWKDQSITSWKLDMHRRPVWHICAVHVLETESQPVAMLSIHATDCPDPLGGYIIFGANTYRTDRLAELQLVVTPSHLPYRFDAGAVNADGYFTLSVFNQNDQVMSISLVPSTKACLEKPVDATLN